MCKRHSFILTRAGKIHHGMGLTDSHTIIRELAGMKAENDSVNAYEWQPPDGWPDADWMLGLTKDTEVFEPKSSHLRNMEAHIRRLYPDRVSWDAGDKMTAPKGLTVGGSLHLSGTAITALPEGLTVGGSLYTPWGNFGSVARARRDTR